MVVFVFGNHIFKKKINEIDNNDILVYLDAGCKITNYYNNNQNSYFIDNRHDQSIFSIIRKKI